MERLGTPNQATGVLHELRKALENQDFNSTAKMETFVASMIESRQDTPESDFLGLSPNQMHSILHGSFDELGSIFTVSGQIGPEDLPAIPLLKATMALLDFLIESGPVKATAKGNLPKAMVLRWWDQEFGPRTKDESFRSFLRPVKEQDCWSLYFSRLVIRKAGLIKLHEYKFSITDRGRKLFEQGKLETIYHELFVALGWGVDWNAGRDDYRALHPLVQQSFVFNLHLLGSLAKNRTPETTLVDAYMKAFPTLMEDYNSSNPEMLRAYLNGIVGYGLITYPVELGLLEDTSDSMLLSKGEYRISPLFKRLIHWKL